MNALIELALSFVTVLLKDTGKADDAVKLLSLGLSLWDRGAAYNAQREAVNAELKAMQDAGHTPTREEKDARYNAILAAIDSVVP